MVDSDGNTLNLKEVINITITLPTLEKLIKMQNLIKECGKKEGGEQRDERTRPQRDLTALVDKLISTQTHWHPNITQHTLMTAQEFSHTHSLLDIITHFCCCFH